MHQLGNTYSNLCSRQALFYVPDTPKHAVAPVTVEYLPASQLVQLVEADVAAYDPPGHGRHVSFAECLPK